MKFIVRFFFIFVYFFFLIAYLFFKCNNCNKAFQKRLALRDHLIYVHNDINSLNVCPVCSEAFSSIKELSLHEKNQHGGV